MNNFRTQRTREELWHEDNRLSVSEPARYAHQAYWAEGPASSSQGFPSGASGGGGMPSCVVGPVLSLNVGGVEFKTTASTLRKAPFFEAMLGSGEHTTNPIFIDRSGDIFRFVLEYLRSGHWLLGDRADDVDFLSALREEANFYGLNDRPECRPWPRISEYMTVWQFRDDMSLYVDCLEQTIREDPAHQGLFRLCKYYGGLPLDQQTSTKRFKAASNYMQGVLAYFAMRGFTLQHILEGSMIMHTTSADGQSRTGHGTQYILHRQISFPATWQLRMIPEAV